MINEQSRMIINGYPEVLTFRNHTYEVMFGTNPRSSIGAYCIWDNQSNEQCLVGTVTLEPLGMIKQLMIEPLLDTERDELIHKLETEFWEVLPMHPALKSLILS